MSNLISDSYYLPSVEGVSKIFFGLRLGRIGAEFEIFRSAPGGPPVCDPQRGNYQMGNPATRGN